MDGVSFIPVIITANNNNNSMYLYTIHVHQLDVDIRKNIIFYCLPREINCILTSTNQALKIPSRAILTVIVKKENINKHIT